MAFVPKESEPAAGIDKDPSQFRYRSQGSYDDDAYRKIRHVTTNMTGSAIIEESQCSPDMRNIYSDPEYIPIWAYN